MHTTTPPNSVLPAVELYQLIKSTDISTQDVEDPATSVVEVVITWGTSVLDVAHVGLAAAYKHEDLVLVDRGKVLFTPTSMRGHVELQGSTRSLQDLVANNLAQPSLEDPTSYELSVQPDAKYRLELANDMVATVKLVQAGKAAAKRNKADRGYVMTVLSCFLACMVMVCVVGFAIMDDSVLLAQTSDEDRLMELRGFLQRQQARQRENVPQQPANAQQDTSGATGTRHAGPEGKMGRRDTTAVNRRYAIRNNNMPQHLSRETARQQVGNRGVFLALGAPGGGMSGGASGIVSPFGALTESGIDDRNANGNMNGDEVGDAFGYGGLGDVGTGWGGDSNGEGTIGTGAIGTLGHGSCTGTNCEYGLSAGNRLTRRETHGPGVRPRPPEVIGLLSPEAIRRVVLRNIGQINHCYEQGLNINPTLAGRVIIRFVIGGTGIVMGSSVADSSISLPGVSTCMSEAARRWQFPAPEGGGVVTVNYPFNLQPADL